MLKDLAPKKRYIPEFKIGRENAHAFMQSYKNNKTKAINAQCTCTTKNDTGVYLIIAIYKIYKAAILCIVK